MAKTRQYGLTAKQLGKIGNLRTLLKPSKPQEIDIEGWYAEGVIDRKKGRDLMNLDLLPENYAAYRAGYNAQ